MTWWRDNIFSPNSPPSHPILISLRRALGTHNLTTRYLERMLEARERDLDRHEPRSLLPTLSEVELFAEETQSNMLYLTLESLNIVGNEEAARHVGIYIGLVTLLRGTLYHFSNKQPCFIPQDLLTKRGVSLEEFYYFASGKSGSGNNCADVVSDIVFKAREHLEIARSLEVKPVPAFLSAVSSQLYLEKLEAAEYSLAEAAQVTNVSYHWRLLYNRLCSKSYY